MNNNTKIIYLRHADTEKDPSLNAAFWGLSEKGKEQAIQNSKNPLMQTVDIIYASTERKTSLTAEPIAKMLGKEIHESHYFDEVKRGDKFLKKEDFEAEKEKQLSDLSYNAFDGESGIEALARFKSGIMEISEANKGKNILLVTHGTILNIYFANLLDKNKEIVGRWKKTTFDAYGITENGKVTKDII